MQHSHLIHPSVQAANGAMVRAPATITNMRISIKLQNHKQSKQKSQAIQA